MGVDRGRGIVIGLGLLVALGGCSGGEGRGDAGGEVEAVWLETGTGPGQTVYPRAVARDPKTGWLYVVDRQARVQRLDENGKYLSGWVMPNLLLGKPVGMSVGPDGNLYVADTHYHRVMVYSPEGVNLRQWGKEGNGKGEFVYPTDVAFDVGPDGRGRVFVSEYGDNDRVQVFSMEGEWLFEFGRFGQGEGEFSRPQSMVILGGEVFVTDACNHRIQVFGVDGTFRRSLGSVGEGDGELRFPYGLVADGEGKLIVTEFGNNRIQRLDPVSGKGLGTWGKGGRGPGELAFPWASEVDGKGRVVVVDSGNNRLMVVRGF